MFLFCKYFRSEFCKYVKASLFQFVHDPSYGCVCDRASFERFMSRCSCFCFDAGGLFVKWNLYRFSSSGGLGSHLFFRDFVSALFVQFTKFKSCRLHSSVVWSFERSVAPSFRRSVVCLSSVSQSVMQSVSQPVCRSVGVFCSEPKCGIMCHVEVDGHAIALYAAAAAGHQNVFMCAFVNCCQYVNKSVCLPAAFRSRNLCQVRDSPTRSRKCSLENSSETSEPG